MQNIDSLMERLGKINSDNQNDYFDLFTQVGVLDEQSAIKWLSIFDKDDYNDYGALAWEIVFSAQSYVNLDNIARFRSIANYWSDVLLLQLDL